jgi:hypothetical protein
MSYSYNQIITDLKQVAMNNLFINRFGSGDISDIDAVIDNSLPLLNGTPENFPICWVVPQTATVGINTLNYMFRILVFDIDNTDDSHQQDILSDTLRTLIDIIKVYTNENTEVDIETDNVCTPFTERFTEYCVGWYCDITIITNLDNNHCDIATY